ncbi:glutathione S-transferase family protein [Minwuia thermotolerans]|uniref:Glutathione S-transferase n=1 Tax=Minwuia thermotolerans TaxID=2056226 RepID=A0A2M9G7N6_9PROT|nr:glutathione S-transferase family protein [Minwuia thermotolerans]PJK31713.1 glutathione S-transferase [Minwuia thermotolerans]
MITIHHLGVSQSDRVVWLMEELGLPYELKWYRRKANRLMPDDYVALHPAATAPVIDDDGRRLTESAVILEHICHRHAGGRFTVSPDQANYPDYLYWMHFNNNALGLYFAQLALGANPEGETTPLVRELLRRRWDGYYAMLEQTLGRTPYLAGDEITCADFMTMYDVVRIIPSGGRSIDDLPNTKAYAARIGQRPAYRKAMEIAGPEATPPG